MTWAIAGGLLLLLLLAVVIVSARKYRRLLAASHLVELGQGLVRLKASALDASRSEGVPDPAKHVFVSSAGAVVAYTVASAEDAHQHHLSLSYRGGPLALGAAGILLSFCARTLPVPMAQIQVGRSDRGVFHAVWSLSDEAHDALAATPAIVPNLQEIPSVMAACLEEARRLGPIARIALPPEINAS
ncbi:hypothetical protein [Chondromyces apiculatus]|uniref:Uncharacterized protein n=1 Tax=Chondromyces apiculatus DSM 436 TaxID=1192034 RepID=A0A017TEQ7_9BACT|nr:hypothetical protein [Chondromyces apiculatus]EYF07315.1 Hypothetical protein CAP_0794 [Chondromyces apiculatus DSM 436]